MICAEKKELQDQCMAASTDFERATQDVKASTGVLVDMRARTITDHRSGQRPTVQESFAEAIRYSEVLRKYHSASSALSRHLSTHRC
jgi:hypothetical protein